MRFDLVHDTQAAHRQLLTAFSFPGRIVDLSDLAARIDAELSFNPAVMVVALTLLDAEVGFSLFSPTADRDARLISRLTYSRQVRPEEARFVFVLGDATDPAPAIQAASVGTLTDPHEGATVILETARLSEYSNDGCDLLLLSGPGIPDVLPLSVAGASGWVDLRASRNVEYPLGIDVIVVDPSGSAFSLPRTTRVDIRPARPDQSSGRSA